MPKPSRTSQRNHKQRKLATELMGASLKNLCALDCWKDHNTILKCYQQPDPEAMRLALENRGPEGGRS